MFHAVRIRAQRSPKASHDDPSQEGPIIQGGPPVLDDLDLQTNYPRIRGSVYSEIVGPGGRNTL